MGKKVNSTIKKRNLQSFWKACARPSNLYLNNTSITPALGKWVANSATWIVDSKDYKSLIYEIIYIFKYGHYSNKPTGNKMLHYSNSNNILYLNGN